MFRTSAVLLLVAQIIFFPVSSVMADLPYASSYDPSTGETVTVQGNPDGSRTITRQNRDGNVIEKRTEPARKSKAKKSEKSGKENFWKKLFKSPRFKNSTEQAKREAQAVSGKMPTYSRVRAGRTDFAPDEPLPRPVSKGDDISFRAPQSPGNFAGGSTVSPPLQTANVSSSGEMGGPTLSGAGRDPISGDMAKMVREMPRPEIRSMSEEPVTLFGAGKDPIPGEMAEKVDESDKGKGGDKKKPGDEEVIHRDQFKESPEKGREALLIDTPKMMTHVNPETGEQISVMRNLQDGSITVTKLHPDGTQTITKTDKFGNPIVPQPYYRPLPRGEEEDSDGGNMNTVNTGLGLLSMLAGSGMFSGGGSRSGSGQGSDESCSS